MTEELIVELWRHRAVHPVGKVLQFVSPTGGEPLAIVHVLVGEEPDSVNRIRAWPISQVRVFKEPEKPVLTEDGGDTD